MTYDRYQAREIKRTARNPNDERTVTKRKVNLLLRKMQAVVNSHVFVCHTSSCINED